jgi:hypothetical protein
VQIDIEKCEENISNQYIYKLKKDGLDKFWKKNQEIKKLQWGFIKKDTQ